MVLGGDAAEVKPKGPAGAGADTKNGDAVVSNAVRRGFYQKGIPEVVPKVAPVLESSGHSQERHAQENNGIHDMKELERIPAPEKAHTEISDRMESMVAEGKTAELVDLVTNDAATAIATLVLDKNAALRLMTQTDAEGMPLAELAAIKHTAGCATLRRRTCR